MLSRPKKESRKEKRLLRFLRIIPLNLNLLTTLTETASNRLKVRFEFSFSFG